MHVNIYTIRETGLAAVTIAVHVCSQCSLPEVSARLSCNAGGIDAGRICNISSLIFSKVFN